MTEANAGTFFLLLLSVLPCAAQQTEPPPAAPPAIRRWLDIQHVQLSSRFRWIESSTGILTSSTHQWQPQVRARFLVDPQARVSVHIGAFGGSQFVSSWNNTGGGVGTVTRNFAVKQLFVAVEPQPSFELQVGGLYLLRGENTEITSYDNDGFIVGERVAVRRTRGPLALLSATVGHIGDYRTPNVFNRFRTLDDPNYAQLLVGARLSPRVNVSADYTYEDGRDILREAATWRVAGLFRVLAAVKVETYQRLGAGSGQGFNIAADLRLSILTVTAGTAHVDRGYPVAAYTSPNADRFERGSRFYSLGSIALTRDVSIGWFQGEAFSTDYAIPNKHRYEVLVTINPTATLKAKRVF